MPRATTVRLFPQPEEPVKKRPGPESRANNLGGKEWTKYSISVWRDIRKTAEEAKLGHPAMFPGALVERLLLCFTKESERTVLDPFLGSGATLAAAKAMGKSGIGFEVAKDYWRFVDYTRRNRVFSVRGKGLKPKYTTRTPANWTDT